jgi:hypothetical protein
MWQWGIWEEKRKRNGRNSRFGQAVIKGWSWLSTLPMWLPLLVFLRMERRKVERKTSICSSLPSSVSLLSIVHFMCHHWSTGIHWKSLKFIYFYLKFKVIINMLSLCTLSL